MSRAESVWIEAADALVLHDRLLPLHGGGPGLREEGVLNSARARAQQIFAYDERADGIDFADVLTSGMVKNHLFVDGNKRAGFVVGVLFLELNGHAFTDSESAVADALLALAAGGWTPPGMGLSCGRT